MLLRDEKMAWVALGLVVVLMITALVTVASRIWMLESHRTLKQAERRLSVLREKERALDVERVFRHHLNTIERRARKELGMRPPRPNQWIVVPPEL